MARAAGSNTKFASVNLNKSYGKPAGGASTTGGSGGAGNGSGLGSGGALGGGGGSSGGRLLARSGSSSGGGMFVLSRGAGAAGVAPKGGKVIVPRPVNLPSLRREHAGNDPSIALVGGSGAGGWTKAPVTAPVQEDVVPVAHIASETGGMTRLAPALSAGSTWGTSTSLPGQTSAVSLSGEQWPVPTQAGASVTNHVAVGRPGVYTPPRARAMQIPTVTSGHVVAVEKAVVLRGEDFPTLQAALPPPPVSVHQKQKEHNLKQREKQQELKDQQHKLQLLSEQHAVLKPDEAPQSQLGGPQLQPTQPSSVQSKTEQIQKDAAEESRLSEQQGFPDSGLSGRPSSKGGSHPLGPASSGPYPRRQSNWTDDERDSTFRPQGGGYLEWNDRPDRESDQPANRGGENFGYGRPLPSREMPFTPGRDGHPGKIADGRESRYNGDSSFGRESSTAGYGIDSSFSRGSNTAREGGYREWGGGVNFGGRGLSREGNRDSGPNKNGGDGRPISRDRDGFDDRHGFGNRDLGPHRDASSGRESGPTRDNFFGRDNRRIPSGDHDAGRGRLGGDRFMRSGAAGDFFNGRGFSGQELGAGKDRRVHDGYHFNVLHGRSSEEIHGLDNFRPSQGVGIDPPMIPMLGFRRRKEEAKENDFRDEEREAFEAELERVQKAQELDRQRKQEEKEHAVEMAQKELEDRERQAREEEERQVKEEEAAKEAIAKAEQEALEAAQKLEDERKAREEEKRQLQLEEEQRKENARRKLLELEERIAKREAESKQQEEARQYVDQKPVNVWQSGEEEELNQREDVEREEEERIVASITGNAHDDDDRAPLQPSVALSYSQVSQRALQPEIPLVKSSEVQTPSAELTARVPEFRGSNVIAESERAPFTHWRREQPGDRVMGSAPQMYPPHGRNENIDFQASISRDRVYNGRGHGDRGDGFHGGPPNAAGFSSEGAPGEFSRRPHFNDQRWGGEEPGFFNKQTNHNRTSIPDYEGGALESLEDRDDRRWGRDRMDRWRSGREGPGQRPSPPQTPPYFHGSESTEPSSFGRLRHSLSRQPRVPPPPGRAGPVRPLPRLSSEQTYVSNSQVRGETGISTQQEIPVDRNFSFSSQEDSDELHAEDSRVKSTGADVQQDVPQQHNKPWSSIQGGWQQFSTSSLTPPSSFAQVSQGLSHEDLKANLYTPAQGSSVTMQNGDSPSPGLSQSEDDYEQKESVVSEVVSEIDKQEMHVQSDDKSIDRNDRDDVSPTDVDEDDEGEDEDDGGDEEGYEAYEAYDEEEDDDKEVEFDGVDGEVEGRVGVTFEGGKDQEFTAADLNERVIEVVGATNDDAGVLQVQAAELAHSGQFQMIEEMGSRLLTQEEAEQTILQPSSVTGLTKESNACDAALAPSQQLQPPLSFMDSSIPQANSSSIPSSHAYVWQSGLHHPLEVPMTVQFGLLPGTSLLQGSVPAIQIGSIQTPLHVPPHNGLQPVPHPASIAPLIQFGQLVHPPSLLQSTPVLSPSALAASVSTQVQAQIAESDSALKVSSHEQQNVHPVNASVEGQPGKDSISLQPQSPWMNQFVSVEDKSLIKVETKETRFIAGSPGQRPERKVRDRGVAREGPSSISGSEAYSRTKNSRRDFGNQRSPQENIASQGATANNLDPVGGIEKYGGRGRGNRPGSVPGRGGFLHSGRHTSQSASDNIGLSSGMNADSAVLRPRSNRRNNFRRTDLKYRDSAEQGFDASGVKFSKQSVNVSTESLDASTTSIDSRDGSRDTDSQMQERSYSGDVNRKFRATPEGGSASHSVSKSERTGTNDASKKNGGKFSGVSDGLGQSSESLLGKHSSEATLEVPGSLQLGAEREDEDDFIEVRSKRQMLSDRRAEREKEIKAKSNLKAKEQQGRKQRVSAKIGSQTEGLPGQGSKSSGFVEKRTSSANLDNVGNPTRVPQSGNTSTVTVASVVTVSGSSQGTPLAPIGTPSAGLSDMRTSTLKSSRSNSASVVDSDVAPVVVTSESQSLHQEGISGTPIAWGGTHSTRQVVSLTQIQLEEAMKPARYEAPVSQQLPLEARGSMVLEPGTTVASLTGKDKLSGSATAGPIGSLLAGDKIQFGAVTSPTIGVSNSHPHTSALLNVVGSSLGSHVDGVSEKNDLKKSNHLSSSELDISSFSTKGKRTRGQEEIGGSAEGGIDAEAEAEAAASAVAVAAISSDESVCSTREPMSIRITNMKNSFGGVASSTNHSGLGLGNSMLEDSMAAALPADLSVEPTSLSIRGSPGQASSVLSTSGQSSFSGLEMSQMLGFPFGSGKDVQTTLQGSNDQGVPSSGPSASGWQPQHSGADSFYGGPPPSGFPGQYINPGAGMPPHMLVYTNPFSTVGQFGQLGYMSPTYLPSGKQPDWKHTPMWSSGPGVAGMNSNDGLGGMNGSQRGSGNMQRVAPGPAVVPVVQSPGPFDLNLSAPFQIPNVDSNAGWSHVPMSHVPMSMGYMPQGRRGPTHPMEKDGGFSLGLGPSQVNNGNFTSMDAAAQFPDELGLGDTSSSVPSMASPYGAPQNMGRSPINNQAANISPSAQSNNKLRSNRRSSRVTRGNLMSTGNGNNPGSVNMGMSVNSGGYNNPGANGSRVPPNHMQPQPPHHLYQAMGGMGQPHGHHSINHSDQRGSSQQNSPRVGSAGNWSGSPNFRKGSGNQGRPPVGERGSSGEKIFVPPSKLKQVYVAKPSSSPRRSSNETAIFNGTEGGQAAVGL